MKILITLSEINNSGNWEKFCEIKGYDYYCMTYGGGEHEVELTFTEAVEIGIITKNMIDKVNML